MKSPTAGYGVDSSNLVVTPPANLGPTTQASMFNNATNPRFKDSSFYNIQNTTNINGGNDALKGLYKRVARHAISNIGGRAEDAKCHPATRVEVIGLIERWMDAGDGLSRIMWLSGPAGAGKTAIMKTVTERCRARGIHTCNFFFFRGDTTRNYALPFVATLVYQILLLYPAVHDAVAGILSTNPLVLAANVEEQFNELIQPLFDVVLASCAADTRIVLHIDGLDECDVDANLDQTRIIQALSKLATRPHSPFLVLIASRPEAHIQMAFNRVSSKVESIFLDDKYLPQEDIRTFVNAEFETIKSSHPSAHSLPEAWPSLSDVEEIVTKSSGQFIYAATVMRYIGIASTVPSLSLERVKGIIPATGNSPFAHLDSIYTFILSRAADQEATRAIMGINILEERYPSGAVDMDLVCHYDPRCTKAVVESCVAELSAILQLTLRGDFKSYHASMTDFLLDRSRAGVYWIDLDAFMQTVVVACWKPTHISDDSLRLSFFSHLEKPTTVVTHMLLNLPLPEWTLCLSNESENMHPFLDSIYTLYYHNDLKTYKRIVGRFIYFSLSKNSWPNITDIPHAQGYLMRYGWWFKLRNTIRRKKWKITETEAESNSGSSGISN